MNNLNRSGGQNYKKHGNARDYSLRMSRVADDKLLSNSVNSVHDFSGATKRSDGMPNHDMSMHGSPHGHHNHSKSLMKGSDELGLIDKKKEILDKKRYE